MDIAIVAGEASGDLLGSGLVESLRELYPQARFSGIAGPLMKAQGVESLHDMDRLAVMGYIEPLARLPELLSIRSHIIQHFMQQTPDVYIGIDAPDFNLGVERKLRESGIKTVHYVSPSVWAWRQSRIKKIARSVDLMLTLFPFEAEFYRRHDVPVEFVGHPLADMIPVEIDQTAARNKLSLPLKKKIIALLPGSRKSEIRYLARDFLLAAAECFRRNGQLLFVVPFINDARRDQFEQIYTSLQLNIPITRINGQSRDVLAASDIVLVASGTATLETLLLKKPMVVAYRMAPLAFWLASRMLKVENTSLPNILSQHKVLPEFLQNEVKPDRLADELMKFLDEPEKSERLIKNFTQIHDRLRKGANKQAANAISLLLENTGANPSK